MRTAVLLCVRTRSCCTCSTHVPAPPVQTFLNSFPRSPEYISLYIDGKLRKGFASLTDAQADDALDKVLQIFRCGPPAARVDARTPHRHCLTPSPPLTCCWLLHFCGHSCQRLADL